ncbi:conserved Plasmodium protein, unknown function [Plasmodium knowlesi strain H]|uniref:Oocyst capsule protein n=4 Tax=Plasmodium knowlesi TaxID=5850 RepID=A0A5K1UEY2_PLAKH|nr:conserved Plasmodium protein, unknown function [Plasmodium knowlesi strain H]OTN68406.1 Uncharacterized protein PKNOH_S02299300 [Plasmodium knowlesi]CAA9986498.1 conserved Plasmodium protein, unknown function [Plasmodium knowlesi strain H]SBO24243.1 conserved Plasmodium protein, unknown function [Plasmodium knowlesi strain H]SBO29745.1 conserved Plasmodium protein, unknown function [Plasmodium knowlesi strain H]VVS75972.1 conserved Plasmodium protein, unknown function [Plasmodium knowlesi s|eukprot:XP_002261049.1 hypothetical protein, conserved in Plasmodium species [Plasmodium knowlesi strain H]
MGLLLLAYLLASFTKGRKNDIIYGDFILFNNLNDEKNLRYYGSESLDKCYWWYFLSEDFFEIVYLEKDGPTKRRKGGKAEKLMGVQGSKEATGKSGKDAEKERPLPWGDKGPPGRSITITSDGICASEILILLNKKKATCKSISSFFVRVNSQGEEKKYIAVEYLVSSQLYMVSSDIVTYKNQNESRNVYVISDNGKKISISESSHFNVFFDEMYVEYAYVKYGKGGELELQLKAKGKVGMTKVIIVLLNKCKSLFFVANVFVYEWLSLLPNGVDFPEGAHVRLVLRRDHPPKGKNNHPDYESGNMNYDSNSSDGGHFSCTTLIKRHILRMSSLRRKATIAALLNTHVEGRQPIKRNVRNLLLINCINNNYVREFRNEYQIQQSSSYDIVSDEVVKIKEGTSGKSLEIVIKSMHSGQLFSSRVNIHRVAKSELACFAYIGRETRGSGTPNRDTPKKRKRNNAFEGEIELIKTHFFYKEHYYLDDLYIESFFQSNVQGGEGEKFIFHRKYLCLMHLYGEGDAKLHGVYRREDVKLVVSSRSQKLSILPLHLFPEYGAYYFMPIRKGGEISLEMTYMGNYASRKDVFISSPVKCYMKGSGLSMSSLFVLLDETIFYQCSGGRSASTAGKGHPQSKHHGGKHAANGYTVKVYNRDSNFDVSVHKAKLRISKRKPLAVRTGTPEGNSHKRRHNKGIQPSGKNRFDIICLLICDDTDLNNCFLSTVYVGERVVHLSAVAQKSIIEENEVTNVYIFMRLGWITNKVERPGRMTLLERRKNGHLKRMEALQGGTSISSCFDVVHHHMRIKYDKNYLEVVKKQSSFLKLEDTYQKACAFYQVRGKKEKRRIPLYMEYTKERKVHTQISIQIFKKVKAIFCHDFVCSKFIKFGQMINLIVYDGFAVSPYRITVSSESSIPELDLHSNRFLNERRDLPTSVSFFNSLFIAEKFQNELYLSEQRKENTPQHRNIFRGEVFYESSNKQCFPLWKLYNRRLFEYDFRPMWGIFVVGERTRGSSFQGEKRYNSVSFHTKGCSPAFSYEPFFSIKEYYSIQCHRGKKEHVTSNILVKMKTWDIDTSEIVTENHLPVHFKYPSSIQVAVFSKHVERLQVVDSSNLILYKNNDYYVKAFLVDEHENVILTNESFRYTLEEDPSSGDLFKICLKDKSRYMEGTNEKRKNVIRTNSRILINCNDHGGKKEERLGLPPNGMNQFIPCSNGAFLLTVEYTSHDGEGGNVSHYFEKFVSLHFCSRMSIWYENHLVLFFSPDVYYSLPICTTVDRDVCPMHALRYSVKGTNRIKVLGPSEGEKLSKVSGHGDMTSLRGEKTERSLIMVNMDNPKDPPKKCTRVYLNSAFEAKGVLTIQNQLVYETDHLEIHFAFAKLTKVKVSLLVRNVERGGKMGVPMKVEFFDKHNRKINMLPKQLLQVKLVYDYNKRIEMTPLNLYPEEWKERVGQFQTPEQSTTEERKAAVKTDMFFEVRSSHEGKYYIQVEVKYKLANKHISILSNMTPLIVYSRGISLYGGGNSILLHQYHQTLELPFQLCHPLIHKVVCLSKNEKLVEVEGVFKLNGEQCTYVCSIKSGNSVGNSEIHVFPILESYYQIFSQEKGRTNFESFEKFEEDFNDLESYYDNYLEHHRKRKKCHNTDAHAHTCKEIEDEKKLRNLLFLKFDVTVDYVRSMKLFSEDTIWLTANEEVDTFASFYSGGGDTSPFLSLDFRLVYERTGELFQMEYFVNDGSVLLSDGRNDHEQHRQRNGFIPARRTVVTDLRVSSDAFLSIQARKEGRFLLYANFTKYSRGSHQAEVVYSQVYNLIVQRNGTKESALPVIHLMKSGVYKFDRSLHCLTILANWTYEQRFPLSAKKKISTERKAILHNAHYLNKEKNIYKKFLINVSDISSMKLYNYFGKFIPLNVVQYLSIHLYNTSMARVVPPLNGKLYVHVSHPTVLTVKTVGPNHIFIVPHKLGCSFIHVNFYLHQENHPEKHPPDSARYNPRDYLPIQGGDKSAQTLKMHLCVTKRVPTKYFQKRKNYYYLNRVYKLLGRYSLRFFQQPYMCVNSVTRKEAKLGKISGAVLSKSKFYRVYKHYDGISMVVKEFEDLFQYPTGHLSIINDHCSSLKL